jgi:hypothetical protein
LAFFCIIAENLARFNNRSGMPLRFWEVFSIDRNIQITVINCVVTLEGTVFSPETWQLAADLTADMWGVSEIHNHLKFQPGPGNS